MIDQDGPAVDVARYLTPAQARRLRDEHAPVDGRCPHCRSSDTSATNRGECSLFRGAGLALARMDRHGRAVPTPICRHCGKVIQTDPRGGWEHSSPRRKRCQDGGHEAEPRD